MADATFDDARLRRRIAWLNNAGGFENKIIYSKVAEAAEGLTDNKIMDILRYVEENYDKIWDPMRWILSSLEKAKGALEGLDSEADQQLRRRIRWLNNEGGFENAIMYAKVAEAAVGLDPRKVMEVLKYLEERWEWVEDPTAWVCAALRKASSGAGGAASSWGTGGQYGSSSWGGGKGSWAGEGGGKGRKAYADAPHDEEKDRKLRTRIRWLNNEGGFENKIIYDKVAEAAQHADLSRVMEILQYLEENWQKVGDPTAWVCNSLRKSGAHGPPADEDFDRKLRARIRWLNNEGGFRNVINYSKIAQAASSASPDKVFTALKYLEDKGPDGVNDPTTWVCAGIVKGQRGDGGGRGYAEDYGDYGSARPPLRQKKEAEGGKGKAKGKSSKSKDSD